MTEIPWANLAAGDRLRASLQALPAILNPGEDRYDETSEQQSDSHVIIRITVRDTYRPLNKT
jgi:hypothetical protein